MSRTDLDATTLANSLRMRAGDGSMEWVYEPIQASVLLDIADMLDENAKLRELARGLDHCTTWANEDGKDCWSCPLWHEKDCTAEDIEHELGTEVDG